MCRNAFSAPSEILPLFILSNDENVSPTSQFLDANISKITELASQFTDIEKHPELVGLELWVDECSSSIRDILGRVSGETSIEVRYVQGGEEQTLLY